MAAVDVDGLLFYFIIFLITRGEKQLSVENIIRVFDV